MDHLDNNSRKLLRHGADVKTFAREAGIDEKDVHDFSSNINPLGPSASVKQTYHSSLESIIHYPDRNASKLLQTISRYHKLSVSSILAGNGSISLIDLAIRALKPKMALLIEPCFNEYRRLLELSGAQVDQLVLKEEDGFGFPVAELRKRLADVDLLILGHPNNPTGTALSSEQLLDLIREAERVGTTVLIDEAFIDWHADESVIGCVSKYPSAVVIRSLTKFYSLAGIRAGYACAKNDLIDRMRALSQTWECNALAQKLAATALLDTKFQLESWRWFQKEHAFMYASLSEFEGLHVFKSRANFFLCKIIDDKAVQSFWQAAKEAGIYLREVDDFIGLDKNFFRVALKEHTENIYFLNILKTVLIKHAEHGRTTSGVSS